MQHKGHQNALFKKVKVPIVKIDGYCNGRESQAVGIRGLKAGQGQLAKADGSAVMATDADISPQGAIGKKHIFTRGGQTKYNAATLMALPY